MEVLREEQTVNEIAAKYELSPVMVSRWKAEFLERSSMVFEKGPSEVDQVRKEYESKQENLEKLVGQLTVEVDCLKKIWPQIIPLKSVKKWSSMITQPSASSVRLNY
jgi:transposase